MSATAQPQPPERSGALLRRLVTVPLFTTLFVVLLLTAPLWLLAALPIDLFRKSRFSTMRFGIGLTFYLGCEVIGIAASALLWIVHGGPFLNPTSPTWLDRHYRLQAWWAGSLFSGIRRVYSLNVIADGEDKARLSEGPIIVLIRHASVADTLLPSNFIAHEHGVRLRYILKKELLWDPCLDIVGNRLPNYFVERGSDDPEREIAGVVSLARGLGDRDGVLIYPEGTRYTPEKHTRVMARLKDKDPEMAARSAGLHYVLPPRLGGSLGLLGERAADIVFFAHTGFERVHKLDDLINGSLAGQTLRLRFWRVALEDIPTDRDGQIDWLFDQWSEMDAWVELHGQHGDPAREREVSVEPEGAPEPG